MAQFYGILSNTRGETTRTGTKNDYLTGHVRGWRAGASVTVCHNDEDLFAVHIDGGSGGARSTITILKFGEKESLESIARSLIEQGEYILAHADVYSGWPREQVTP